jgi:ABC-type transporter Mla MlaB component
MKGLRLAGWLKYQRVNSTAMATLAEYLSKFKRENANVLLDLFNS